MKNYRNCVTNCFYEGGGNHADSSYNQKATEL